MATPENVPGGRPIELAAIPGYATSHGVAVDRAGTLIAATQHLTGTKVLIRVLTPALGASSSYMHRLRRQAPTLLSLRDEHLVPVVAFEDRARAVVYLAGGGLSLSGLIDGGDTIPLEAAFVLFDDCLAGLDALHRAGLVHEDVRPGSIVVDGTGKARLRDACVPSPPLRAGWAAGTPQYMAPELWAGTVHSPSTDLYAASCVFFEALTGRPPYPALDLAELRRQHERDTVPEGVVPAAARSLVLEGTAKHAMERPAGAGHFRADLTTAADAFLADGWRAQGRSWLAAAARERPADAPQPPALAGALDPGDPDADGAVPVLAVRAERRLRDRKIWAGAAAAAVALLVVVVTAAGLNRTSSRGSQTAPPAQLAPTSPAPTTALAGPSGSATSPGPTSSGTTPSSGFPAGTAPTATPGAVPTAPATPPPSPTPAPSCFPVVPVCP